MLNVFNLAYRFAVELGGGVVDVLFFPPPAFFAMSGSSLFVTGGAGNAMTSCLNSAVKSSSEIGPVRSDDLSGGCMYGNGGGVGASSGGRRQSSTRLR